MKIIFTILILICVLNFNGFSQNFKQEFDSIYTKPDTAATLTILQKWQKSTPNDPELYIAFFNFYATKSMTEVVNMQTNQQGQNSLEITDPKTHKVVGYLNDGATINVTELTKGFVYIEEGIKKFPDRLDMRFGEIYMLGKIPDYNSFTSKLIQAIDYGRQISWKWKWKDNMPLNDPQKFLLNAEQNYIGQIYDAGDTQLDNMKSIAEAVLKYYPDNVENLSNLAITFMVRKNYNEALLSLLKATKVRPEDAIILNNIAYCYKGLNDKLNAIKYYQLMEKYGSDNQKTFAKGQLDELQKH